VLRNKLLSGSALGLVLLCGSAFADTLEIVGSTSGAFYLGPIDVGTTAQNLKYKETTFDTTSTTINLGSFTLGACIICYYDVYDFRLSIDFALPLGITPDPLTSRADVTGLVVWKYGGATVNFGNTPIHMAYDNGGSQGTFDLVLSDVSVNVGRTAQLYGTIQNRRVAATESESILVVATICGAVLWLFRKRFAPC
jgi:hypothetical protein